MIFTRNGERWKIDEQGLLLVTLDEDETLWVWSCLFDLL
jgi:hypothetical protein